MKKTGIMILSVLILSCSTTKTQNQEPMSKENEKITAVINGFSAAGDINNVKKLNVFLDDNYRVVMNRLFGSKTVSVMSKEEYLEKIETKVFGGDTRVVTVEKIMVNGSTAVAKVIFKGEKATFHSLMTLLKDESGSWKLASDIPILK